MAGLPTAELTGQTVDDEGLFRFLVGHADDNLVLAQRLGEWVSRAPELEEDLALANLALDHLGQARALFTYAAEVQGEGKDEDDLAFLRTEQEFTNKLLVEQPNGDFAQTMVRQMFFDAYQLILWEQLSEVADSRLAGIAAKANKEATYHFRHSSGWVVRLGDGTDESHRRTQRAVERLWRFTAELFESGEVDAAIGRGIADQAERWLSIAEGVLDEATLTIPDDPFQRSGGRAGAHTEHLGHLLSEMQWMQRTYPGLEW
ncbi:MAG TPA: phenylacetate-CoA oxygenase subunit PaaI [Actinobacteria bacterium]|nr:phenylacetate-CoA oxygenase subunit PaaI [Actinomycetota bacterium]